MVHSGDLGKVPGLCSQNSAVSSCKCGKEKKEAKHMDSGIPVYMSDPGCGMKAAGFGPRETDDHTFRIFWCRFSRILNGLGGAILLREC